MVGFLRQGMIYKAFIPLKDVAHMIQEAPPGTLGLINFLVELFLSFLSKSCSIFYTILTVLTSHEHCRYIININ
jgi:hypothetical protein